MLGEKFSETTLQEALKSGERLCLVLNKVFPDIIRKVNKSKFAAAHRENIGNYVSTCKGLNFDKSSLFETADLYDGKNMIQVLQNIDELSYRAARKGEFPSLKPTNSKGGYDVVTVEAGGKKAYCADCGAPHSSFAKSCADCGKIFEETTTTTKTT